MFQTLVNDPDLIRSVNSLGVSFARSIDIFEVGQIDASIDANDTSLRIGLYGMLRLDLDVSYGAKQFQILLNVLYQILATYLTILTLEIRGRPVFMG